jgi:TRAP-type uncharacterized transport system substrate-binding protein
MSIEDKHIVFGGAGGWGVGTPWGTLGEIAAKALAPHGYELTVDAWAWGANNPRYVGDATVDFGATQLRAVRQAYKGDGPYESDGPRTGLRVIACINHPGWIAVAVRADTGITDLAQIEERRLPVRVLDRTPPSVHEAIWGHYGLTREKIESWGGRFLVGRENVAGVSPHTSEWVRSGIVDVLVGYIYTSYTLEVRHRHEASVLYDLLFLQLPPEVIAEVSTEIGGVPGVIPHHLYRGIDQDIPAPKRGMQAFYGRDDLPDEFACLLTKALDDNRHLFRDVHLPFSYDPANVWQTGGLPLHPASERYYREMGYLR